MIFHGCSPDMPRLLLWKLKFRLEDFTLLSSSFKHSRWVNGVVVADLHCSMTTMAPADRMAKTYVRHRIRAPHGCDSYRPPSSPPPWGWRWMEMDGESAPVRYGLMNLKYVEIPRSPQENGMVSD